MPLKHMCVMRSHPTPCSNQPGTLMPINLNHTYETHVCEVQDPATWQEPGMCQWQIQWQIHWQNSKAQSGTAAAPRPSAIQAARGAPPLSTHSRCRLPTHTAR